MKTRNISREQGQFIPFSSMIKNQFVFWFQNLTSKREKLIICPSQPVFKMTGNGEHFGCWGSFRNLWQAIYWHTLWCRPMMRREGSILSAGNIGQDNDRSGPITVPWRQNCPHHFHLPQGILKAAQACWCSQPFTFTIWSKVTCTTLWEQLATSIQKCNFFPLKQLILKAWATGSQM